MRRAVRLGATCAAVVTALAYSANGATGATRSPAATGESFVRAFLTGDPSACSLATERLQRLVARLGERPTCRAALTNGAAAAAAASADEQATRELGAALEAAQVVVGDRTRELGSTRYWTGPRFRLPALARDLREYQIEAYVGNGPTAARNTPAGRVILDRVHSTRTVLVLYIESDSGTIWRLSGTTKRRGKATRSPTRGVPSSGISPVALTYPAAAGALPRVAVFANVGPLRGLAFVLTLTAELRVDSLHLGAVARPLVQGSDQRDVSTLTDRLVGAWTRQDANGLCTEIDSRLLSSDAFKTLFGAGCAVVRGTSAVRRIVRPGLDDWAADGTVDVALEVSAGSQKLTVHHLVTPAPNGPRVTGLLFDFEEVAELLLRPL